MRIVPEYWRALYKNSVKITSFQPIRPSSALRFQETFIITGVLKSTRRWASTVNFLYSSSEQDGVAFAWQYGHANTVIMLGVEHEERPFVCIETIVIMLNIFLDTS